MEELGLRPLYVFIDESGNFDSSPKGSRFYVFSAVVTYEPWEMTEDISRLHHAILAEETHPGLGPVYLEERLCYRFHATEDKQVVRNSFLELIQQMHFMKIYSIVIRKNRTNPAIREPSRFYSQFFGYLVDYIQKCFEFSTLVIYVDSTAVTKNIMAFKGAIKSEIARKSLSKPFRIYFPNSSSSYFLQVVDYVNWAIFRKWEREDTRSYKVIEKFLGKPELDIFKKGGPEYD